MKNTDNMTLHSANSPDGPLVKENNKSHPHRGEDTHQTPSTTDTSKIAPDQNAVSFKKYHTSLEIKHTFMKQDNHSLPGARNA